MNYIKRIIKYFLPYGFVCLYHRIKLKKKNNEKYEYFVNIIYKDIQNYDCNSLKTNLIHFLGMKKEKIILYDDILVLFTSFSSENYNCFLMKLNQLKGSFFTVYQWQLLKGCFVVLGFFRAANICRNKSVKRSRSILNKFYFGLINEDKRCILNNYKKLNESLKKKVSIFLGCKEVFVRDDVSNYINNKSVCIEGPAQNSVLVNYEDYDCFISNNLFEVSDRMNRIVFYNGEASEMLSNIQNKNEILKSVKFFFCKDMDSHLAIDRFPKENRKKIFNTSNISELFEFSSPYMLPIMLYDLLIRGCNRIFVTGNNLYCSETIYKANYSKYSMNKIERRYTFAVHGIIENFLFLQMLYKRKSFKTDDYFSNILDNDIELYLEKMENIWL